MNLQDQEGIYPTTLKDPIVEPMHYTLRKRKQLKIKKIHTIIPFFVYYHCQETNTKLLSL